VHLAYASDSETQLSLCPVGSILTEQRDFIIIIYLFAFDGCIMSIDKIRSDDPERGRVHLLSAISHQPSAISHQPSITNDNFEFPAANALN
jgi:hypothetical protein